MSAWQPDGASHWEKGGRMYVGYFPMILAKARSFLPIWDLRMSEVMFWRE